MKCGCNSWENIIFLVFLSCHGFLILVLTVKCWDSQHCTVCGLMQGFWSLQLISLCCFSFNHVLYHSCQGGPVGKTCHFSASDVLYKSMYISMYFKVWSSTNSIFNLAWILLWDVPENIYLAQTLVQNDIRVKRIIITSIHLIEIQLLASNDQ